MQITPEQIEILKSLSCHRLSKNDEHRDLVHSFENTRNPNLIDGLRKTAWSEDEEGSTAYYLIKDKAGFPGKWSACCRRNIPVSFDHEP